MTRPTAQTRAGLTARLRGATLDLTPLRVSRPYRRLLTGEAVSVLGTQVTVVAGGPRLGDARAGGGTELVGLRAASVVGGLVVVGVTGVVAAVAPRFRRYDARKPL